MRSHFLAGAHVVLEAIQCPQVVDAWNEPSVLEGQTVGSLCGHLARGSIWVVADYLALEQPASATFDSADDYYATLTESLTVEDHRDVRRRGAEVAAMGFDAIVSKASEALATLDRQLSDEPDDRLVTVFGGMGMRLDPYLSTRIVEQVVHLDDLARSVDASLPTMPRENIEMVLDIGIRVGVRRFGASVIIGGVFRGLPGAFPVL